MIVGIGIDAVDIERIQRWLQIKGLPERFFHPQELQDAQQKKADTALSLAARFAAKEAYGKALGTGLRGITLKNILVTNDPQGRPTVTLFDDALIPFKKINGKTIHLSLTHEKNIAIASVILEGEMIKRSG